MEGTAEFCEVFFDDVRVPVAEPGRRRERRLARRHRHAQLRARHRVRVRRAASRRSSCATSPSSRSSSRATAPPAGRTPACGATSASIAAELDALWALTKRNISQAQRTGLVGVGGNVFKLAFTELRHRLGDVAMHLLDRASLSLDDVGELPTGRHVQARFYALSMTIAAGTSQVQRNIVAERVLGLPRER